MSREKCRRIVGRWVCGTLALTTLGTASALAGGKKCVRDGADTTEVCVEWSQEPDPTPGTDFFVGFDDPYNPDVELRTGDLGYIITSTVVSSGNPANIGDLTINPNQSSDNFGVAIANGAGPGAANVAKFDLTAGGGWSGYSNITGGSISGNLNGDLKAKKSGGSGGGATFTIGGNLTGDIDIYKIAAGGITITGDIKVKKVSGAARVVLGPLLWTGSARSHGAAV